MRGRGARCNGDWPLDPYSRSTNKLNVLRIGHTIPDVTSGLSTCSAWPVGLGRTIVGTPLADAALRTQAIAFLQSPTPSWERMDCARICARGGSSLTPE
jgi:hypothetical protein